MKKPSFSVIFLAGGTGSRMGSKMPKQFLELGGQPIAWHSLEVLLSMPETTEMVIVCDPSLRHHFGSQISCKWASPGPRRQDSVYNGLQQIERTADYVCIHDGCRPFITPPLVRRVFESARSCGASAAGMPVKFTIKEINRQNAVVNTPDRSLYWEIQTPQIVRHSLLMSGFEKALAENLTVTDDVSLAELMGVPVQLVEGAYANIKITSPDDLAMAQTLLKKSTSRVENV